ncbi:hypothetical protein ACVWXO_002639 [Bradyrhizobium sp. LM2.7]
MLEQLGAHALGLRIGLVDLVDGNDDRHPRRLGVVDGFDRLRHHAVIGRNHQHDDVGDLGAACAHRCERGVAGRVDEGDLLAAFRRQHLIGADMLGDAAGLAGDHIGVTERVEQRGLAVVDVAHHGHHRRARLGVVGIVDGIEQAFFDVGCRHALDRMAEFLGDELRCVGIDHVGDLVHRALLHQHADDIDRALGHAVGEFLDGDRFRNDHLADQLFLRLVRNVTFQALGAAAERRDRALAHVAGAERGDERQAAALLLRTRLVGGLGGCHGTHGAAGTATDLARTIILVRPGCNAGGATRRTGRPLSGRRGRSGCGRRRSRRGRCGARCAGGRRGCRSARGRRRLLALAKTLLGLGLGLALGLLFVAVTFFLGLAAGFGGVALDALGAFADGAALGFLFGLATLLDLTHLGIGERAGTRRTLVLGQGPQHHAGTGVARRSSFRHGTRRCSGRGRCRLRNLGCLRLWAVADPALAALFDHDLLAAAVAEALAHSARFDARLER